jgi:hypothetical protein
VSYTAHFPVQYCEKEDKKCLGVAERFNRTIKLMIEKYLTSRNPNRWIDNQSFSIYKIFNSVDVRDKISLFHKINTYVMILIYK